ncbi:hypothetical protein CLD20_13835 [Afifella sp. IM 167]|nr:hypothetical protein [Afifella sp. IM 167]
MPSLKTASASLSLLLFAVFAGNIVMAKIASLLATRVPLLPPLGEFLLLHAATIVGMVFLYCAERDRKRSAGTWSASVQQGPERPPHNSTREKT